MQICTIVRRNSLASARTLARSFEKSDPPGTCWTLVIDDVGNEVGAGKEPFEVVRPGDLSIAPWRRMTAGYEPDELCRAVMPWLVRHLLVRQGGGQIVYLDPRARVLRSLAEVGELLRAHALVVDAIAGGPGHPILAGFAVGDDVNRILERWIESLTANCLVAPERGYLIDQRWLDTAADLHILGDPGDYVRLVVDDSARESDPEPYAWGVLPDGTPLDAAARRAYREGIATGALSDEDVFSEPGCEAFLSYLRGPGRHPGLTTYLEALHGGRRDLQEQFPDLVGADGARLTAWAHTIGRSSGEVAPALLDNPEPGPSLVGGVNVVGYFKGVMGVGEHARQLAGALRTQAIPIITTMLHPEAAPEDDELGDNDGASALAGQEASFNLLCANADSVAGVVERLGADFFADRYTIAFWAWEVSAFPDRFLHALGYLDEVWVGSRHVRDAVSRRATVPVLAIPQPVSLAFDPGQAKPPPGLPDGFRFLFSFDYLSVFERKNPLAVIAAFTREFSPGSGAKLIIKTLNDSHDPVAHARLLAVAETHPDVCLIERRLPRRERDGLVDAADCYVSLHRAEGFGYTLAEAMWLGKPVIATGYSGNLDFMTQTNSYLVDSRLVPIGRGHDPYPSEGVWAEPDVDHAAALMRYVFDHRDEARRRGARAAQDIRVSHGPEVAGRVMRDRLELVMASSAWRSRWSRRQIGESHTDAIRDRLRYGPVPPARPRFGAPQRAARKGLLRLLKPVTLHQRLVDDELVKAIEAIDTSMDSLAASHIAALRRIEELQTELRSLQGTTQRSGRS